MSEQEWVRIQTKTFTNWINDKLSSTGSKLVKDFIVDLNDGTILARILIILTGENFFFHHKPVGKFQKIENIQLVLDFMNKKNIKLVNIGTEDIYGGNLKLMLGLVWTIILRFGVSTLYTENVQATILAWCRATTADYKNVNINGFGKCWKDGLAFNAIIHKFRPELIKYEKLRPENDKENLENAFKLANIHFGIPKLMDPEDFTSVENPDEKSVFTYVTQYYNRLIDYEKQTLQTNIKDFTKNLMSWSIDTQNKYCDVANDFLELVSTSNQNARELEKIIANLISKIKEYYMIRTNTNNKYLYLNHLLGCINMVHKSNDLKPYNPPNNLTPEMLKMEIQVQNIDKNLENLNDEIKRINSDENIKRFKTDFNPQLINLLRESLKNEELSEGLKKYIESCSNNYERKLCMDKLSLIRDMNENERYRKVILTEAHKLFKELDKENKNIISGNDYLNCLFQLGIRKNNLEAKDIDYETFMLDIQNSTKPFYGVVDFEFVKGKDFQKFIDEFVCDESLFKRK
ncbi:Alpha-actinin-4 [Dictyocoela muelleri]|nr:Alpha-actinin-4 [Dictyocoela muelleri]